MFSPFCFFITTVCNPHVDMYCVIVKVFQVFLDCSKVQVSEQNQKHVWFYKNKKGRTKNKPKGKKNTKKQNGKEKSWHNVALLRFTIKWYKC